MTVGGHATLDAKLTLGSGATEVQVVAEGGAQVNTETQELSQVVDREQIQQLPSLTRNPYDFVELSGNVSSGDSSGPNKSQNSTSRGVGFSINGQRSTGTEILLDGVENISVFGDGVGINVPVDAVQEYRVVTSNFEAQYGRASGGVVNVTTLAGTNKFHGRAWEFNRLSDYTANTVLNSQEGNPKGNYTRNQFGFVFGGPIVKDKLFFLGSTEWTRVRSSASQQAAVVTPQYLALAPANIKSYFGAYGAQTFNFTNTYTNAQLGTPASEGTPATVGIPGIAAIDPCLRYRAIHTRLVTRAAGFHRTPTTSLAASTTISMNPPALSFATSTTRKWISPAASFLRPMLNTTWVRPKRTRPTCSMSRMSLIRALSRTPRRASADSILSTVTTPHCRTRQP